MGHNLGNNYGKFYSFGSKPVLLDLNFVVDSTNGNGLGVRQVKGQGVKQVFMHTSAPLAGSGNPNPAAGYAIIELEYNYTRLYSLQVGLDSPLSGSNLAINSTALTPGDPYTIVSVGHATPGTVTISPVADVSGSLTGRYFSLYDGYGNTFIIWFSVGGLGSAPTGVSGTLVQQTIATGATAAQIGAALVTTINGLPSGVAGVFSFTATGTTTVTAVSTQTNPQGPVAGAPMDSALAPTGFTFTMPDFTTNLKDWQGVGLPPGIVPAIGATFIATASGYTTGGGSTGLVQADSVSGITSIELLGDPNTTINPISMGGSPNSGGYIVIQFLDAGTPTAPANGTVVGACLYLEQAARVGGNQE
jgi:hypothetical protein